MLVASWSSSRIPRFGRAERCGPRMLRGSPDSSIAPHHPKACGARTWNARGICPAIIGARTEHRRRPRDHPRGGTGIIVAAPPPVKALGARARSHPSQAASLHPDRDLHAVTLPPLGESRHVDALPPHVHHGAGGSRAPCTRLAGAVHGPGTAGGRVPHHRGWMGASSGWRGRAVGRVNGRRWIGLPCTRVQQLTPVSRSAACRPLAARVMMETDCDRRGTASAALTVGSRRFAKHRTLGAMCR